MHSHPHFATYAMSAHPCLPAPHGTTQPTPFMHAFSPHLHTCVACAERVAAGAAEGCAHACRPRGGRAA
eukprot:356489-Chlamydomonas_euryale.AAC.1